jgi:hypothetical protein
MSILHTANESWDGRAESLTARKWRMKFGRDTKPSDAMQSDTVWALRCIDFEAGSRNKQGSVRAGTQTPAKYVPVPRSNTPHIWSYQIRT